MIISTTPSVVSKHDRLFLTAGPLSNPAKTQLDLCSLAELYWKVESYRIILPRTWGDNCIYILIGIRKWELLQFACNIINYNAAFVCCKGCFGFSMTHLTSHVPFSGGKFYTKCCRPSVSWLVERFYIPLIEKTSFKVIICVLSLVLLCVGVYGISKVRSNIRMWQN